MNYFSYRFKSCDKSFAMDGGSDGPKNETLQDHLKHCRAKSKEECPFVKEKMAEIGSEDFVSPSESAAIKNDSARRIVDALSDKGISSGVVADKSEFDRLLEADRKKFGLDHAVDAIGFYNPEDGKIYLDPDSVDGETALHEFAHPFVEKLRLSKSEAERAFWRRGIELVRESGIELKSGDGYDGLSEEELLNEALADEMGRRGEQALEEADENDVGLDEWGRSFYRKMGAEFGIEGISPEDLAKMTLDDWLDAATAHMFGMDQMAEYSDLSSTESCLGPDQDGRLRFNIRTWYDEIKGPDGELLYRSGRDELKAALDAEVKAKRLKKKDAEDILKNMEEVYGICKGYADSGEFENFTNWSDAQVLLDENGSPFYGVKLPNGDYAYNFDFSTVCKKRRPLDAVFAKLISQGVLKSDENGLLNLDAETIAHMQKDISAAGLEIACGLCFVDSKRFTVATDTYKFVAGWNGLAKKHETDKAWWDGRLDSLRKSMSEEGHKPNFIERMILLMDLADKKKNNKAEFDKIVSEARAKSEDKRKELDNQAIMLDENSGDVIKQIKAEHLIDGTNLKEFAAANPAIYDMFRKNGGAHKAKDSFLDNPWFSDIIRPFSHRQNPNGHRQIDRAEAYEVGGVRLQSFSDFVGSMVFDYMQMFGELAAKRLPMHCYTKEPALVKIFGKTGAKINMSLVPAGDGLQHNEDGSIKRDSEGRPVYDICNETFPEEEAYRLRKGNPNVGTIMVGVSDEHIRAALNDDRIDMVIPYHKSGINPDVAQIRGIKEYKDYTSWQHTLSDKGRGLKEDKFDFYGQLEKLKSPRKVALAYVEHCEQNGMTPKFAQFVYKMGDMSGIKKKNMVEVSPGVYKDARGRKVDSKGFLLGSDGKRIRAMEKNYYKLLADFRLTDDNGRYAPQRDVSMTQEVVGEDGRKKRISAFAGVEQHVKDAIRANEDAEKHLAEQLGTGYNDGPLVETIKRKYFTPDAIRERKRKTMSKIKWDESKLIEERRSQEEIDKEEAKKTAQAVDEALAVYLDPSVNLRRKPDPMNRAEPFVWVKSQSAIEADARLALKRRLEKEGK